MRKNIYPIVSYYKIIVLIGLFVLSAPFKFLIAGSSHDLKVSHKSFRDYNIVLIFIDTLRADHLSLYGYFRKTSPNIDRLAEKSIIFERNFSTISYTNASFMSILTSLYPSSHGVLEIFKDKLSAGVKTLAQTLQVYGYKTVWFGPLRDHHLDPRTGFGQGIEEFVDVPLVLDDQSDQLKNNLCDWLDRNKNKKFFLNLHTYKAHSPYFPLTKYKEKFIKEKRKGIIETRQEYRNRLSDVFEKDISRVLSGKKGVITEYFGEDLVSELIASGLLNAGLSYNKQEEKIKRFFSSKKKRANWINLQEYYAYWSAIDFAGPADNTYIQALYDASILEFDEEVIGPVIEKLKALKLYDKTIIIVTADHGEEFYEHKGYSHGATLYDEVTYVPWIMRVPWIKHQLRVKELSQTVDIMPTLLDLLGIPIPHEAQGKSWADFINNKSSLPLHKYVFGQHSEMSSIRSKEWKFILYKNGRKELYYLISDPKEQQNVYSQNQKISFTLESQLKQWEGSLPSYKDQVYSYPPEIDKETQERIRKTGYW